jgi:hypothetical protein
MKETGFCDTRWMGCAPAAITGNAMVSIDPSISMVPGFFGHYIGEMYLIHHPV